MKNKIQTEKKYAFSILRPAGNDTLLINGIPERSIRNKLVELAFQQFPLVEQVGFYSFNNRNKQGRLEMAGGEFCGNALRSLAYLLLAGNKGELSFQVSGTTKILTAGIKKSKSSFTEIPLKTNSNTRLLENNLWQIDLEGITQLITNKRNILGADKAKKTAKNILSKYQLLESRSAAGVMFLTKKKEEYFMEPVVWVRNIQTFFYETACASGTAAVGMYLRKSVSVNQPSGQLMNVDVRKVDNEICQIFIDGPIQVIEKKGEITI
ncbi:hypothetical protein HGA88_03365 [Candidatus Roizmanbacteria bacterium]|nr:hypothetical protein [Candidatus Roizmanbacteria bacterium]